MKNFLIAFVSFLVLDFVWLGLIIKNFNERMLADIGRFKDGRFDILYLPALGTYVLMALAITVFVVPRLSPVDASGSFLQAVLMGGLMGLIIFGIFDLTNLAILKNYPLLFAVVDLCWGTVVFTLVSLVLWRFQG